MGCVYVLKNIKTKKMYVGQTNNFERRMKEHAGWENKSLIGKAIRRYCWIAFRKYVFYIPDEELDFLERELICRLGTIAPKGYNVKSILLEQDKTIQLVGREAENRLQALKEE